MLVNKHGELIEVAPILQEMDCYFAIDMQTNEAVWVDSKTEQILADSLEVVGID